MGPLGEEHRRGVRHLGQAGALHLEDADFVGAAEAILVRAEDAEGVPALALEVQHRVHHVLQHPRPGDGALFGDVAHHEGGHAGLLGPGHQAPGALAHLPHAARRAAQLGEEHGLDGVDDEAPRRQLLGRGQHLLEVGLGEDVQLLALHPEPLGAHARLPERFFARHIERRAVAGEAVDGHQQQRRLADAGVATDEHQTPQRHPAAQHPVQLLDAGEPPRLGRRLDVAQQHGLALPAAGAPGRPRLAGRRELDLFDQRTPGAALGAAAEPLGGLVAARLTGEVGLRFRHDARLLARRSDRCGQGTRGRGDCLKSW